MSISVTINDAVAIVTIDRPQVRNAIDPETHHALAAVWPRLDADSKVRAIILTGAGDRAFCTGADIPEFLPFIGDKARTETDAGHFCGLTREPPTSKPLIAAINGAALGGGLELALACDLRIASKDAVFGLPEVRLGAIAGAGGLVRLARVVPEAVAMDMILTGRSIDAERALAIGLVSELTSPDGVLDRALAIARMIADNGPIAVRLSKSVVRRGSDMGLLAALELERSAFRRVLLTDDIKEGIAAFGQKRKPEFNGS